MRFCCSCRTAKSYPRDSHSVKCIQLCLLLEDVECRTSNVLESRHFQNVSRILAQQIWQSANSQAWWWEILQQSGHALNSAPQPWVTEKLFEIKGFSYRALPLPVSWCQHSLTSQGSLTVPGTFGCMASAHPAWAHQKYSTAAKKNKKKEHPLGDTLQELQLPIEQHQILRLNLWVSISCLILQTSAQTDLQHLTGRSQ